MFSEMVEKSWPSGKKECVRLFAYLFIEIGFHVAQGLEPLCRQG